MKALLIVASCFISSFALAKTCSCYSYQLSNGDCSVQRDPVNKLTDIDFWKPCRYSDRVIEFCGKKGLYEEYSVALDACMERRGN